MFNIVHSIVYVFETENVIFNVIIKLNGVEFCIPLKHDY